jgi:hypothetical protein
MSTFLYEVEAFIAEVTPKVTPLLLASEAHRPLLDEGSSLFGSYGQV